MGRWVYFYQSGQSQCPVLAHHFDYGWRVWDFNTKKRLEGAQSQREYSEPCMIGFNNDSAFLLWCVESFLNL